MERSPPVGARRRTTAKQNTIGLQSGVKNCSPSRRKRGIGYPRPYHASWRGETMRIFGRFLVKLWRRRRLERDLQAEFAFHRDLARDHANTIGLGNVVRIQEEARDLWRFTFVEDLCRDLFYAVRSLRRAPGFTVVAVLTLALGIGANTAMFTLLHRIMLASLPVREPDQLIELLTDRGEGPPGSAFSYLALQDFRAYTKLCSSIIGFSNTLFHTLIEGQAMERLAGQFVTGDYFSELGVNAYLGRLIASEDDQKGAGRFVAVISHAMWQARLGGNGDAIGKTLVIENVPFTVIGVAPPGFKGLEVGKQIDVWVPLEAERNIRRPSYTSSAAYKWLMLVARVKPEVPVGEAHAELRGLFSRTVLED